MGGNFENIKNLLVEYVSYEPDNYSYNCIGRKTSRNVNTNYLSCIHEMRNKYRELKEHIENLYRTALITLDVSYN